MRFYFNVLFHFFSFKFVFPKEQRSPRSWGRLLVFADYGPCNEDGYICGGVGRTHPLSPSELSPMITEAEEEVILSIFVV